jgi:hypothetical protein
LSSHKAASSVDGSALPVQEQNIVAREEEHDIAVGFRNDHDVYEFSVAPDTDDLLDRARATLPFDEIG